ncbi:hypothetical protein BDV96DRAFT_590827 [Lophiotrema nucula]|uniref:Uncharacterized protein n=1 Tax=Lophiotrema nucula TaxID=690887 RepID=A0A6A5YIL1_9PLEO|nr:hypothetical protein BDV96DRAFT_590827 [Lophiotrema nucula]
MATSGSPTKRKREETPEPGPSQPRFGVGLLTPPPSLKKPAVKLERNESSDSLQNVPLASHGLITPPTTHPGSFAEPQIKPEPLEANVNEVPVKREENEIAVANAPIENESGPVHSHQTPIKRDEAEVKQEILDSLGITPDIAARAVPPNDGKFRLASGEFQGYTIDELPEWYPLLLHDTGDVERTPGLKEAFIDWANRFELPYGGVKLADIPIYDINNRLLPDLAEGTLDIGTKLALKYHLLVRQPEEPGEKYIHRIGQNFRGNTLFEAVEMRGNESYLDYMKRTHMAVREGNEDMAEGLEFYHREQAREIKSRYPHTYHRDQDFRYHIKQSSRWNWRMDGGNPIGLGPLMYPRTVPPVSTVMEHETFKRKCPACGFRAPTTQEAQDLEEYGHVW